MIDFLKGRTNWSIGNNNLVRNILKKLKKSEAYSEPSQTSKMELYEKIVNGF